MKHATAEEIYQIYEICEMCEICEMYEICEMCWQLKIRGFSLMLALALKKQDKKFYKLLLSLAFPIVIQNLINSSLTMVDTIMLGALGQDELAASSVTNALFFVLMLMIFGCASGSGVLISQYWGKKDLKSINKIFGFSLMLSAGISFVFCTLIFLFPRLAVSIVTDKPELIELGISYARFVTYSNLFGAIATIYIGTLRCMENTKFGMYVHSIGILTNTFLNWIMIFGKLGFPAMGIEGAALATLISRVLEFALCVAHAFSKNAEFKIKLSEMIRPGKVLILDFMKYSMPVVFNETLWGLGFSMFTVVYGHMGAHAVASASVAHNIERIVAATMFGIANAAIIMIGKEVGNGNIAKGKLNAHALLEVSVIYGVAICIIILVIIRPFAFRFLNLPQETIKSATLILLFSSIILPVKSYNATMIVGVLRGGGDVKFALLVDVAGIWLLAVPLLALTGLVFKLPIECAYPFALTDEIYKMCMGVWRMSSDKWIRNVTR